MYYLASRRLPLLRARPLLAGAGLSIVVHMVFIGIPIALAAQRAQEP